MLELPCPWQYGSKAMPDELSEKLDAVVANVRALVKSGFPRADAAERALEIERQCVDLLTLWVRKHGMFEAHEYREAEAALDRLRKAVKRECEK
jgi:hypothetical protein